MQKAGLPTTEAVVPALHHIVESPAVQVDPLAMVPVAQAPSAAERLLRSRNNGLTYFAFCVFSIIFFSFSYNANLIFIMRGFIMNFEEL
jgi:hypothetical protein